MKKLLSLLLVLVMALGMATTAFAASGWTLLGFCEESMDKYNYNSYVWPELEQGEIEVKDLGSFWNTGTLELGDIEPGEVLWFELYTMDLEWEGPDGEIYNNYGGKLFYTDDEGNDHRPPDVTLRDLRRAGLQCSVQVASGSSNMDGRRFNPTRDVEFSLEGNTLLFKIPFIEEFVSTEDGDFEFIFSFKFKDSEFRYDITVVGTMTNPVIPVYANHDYVDLSSGCIAEAEEFNENIEADLGNGVSIFTKFFKGKKYYGTATRTDDAKDDIVFEKYPDIDNILHLNTIGLNSTGDVVKLSTDYAKYHVYDAQFNYLGTADQMLPYSDTYYLANKKLDIEDEEADDAGEDEPDDEPDDE